MAESSDPDRTMASEPGDRDPRDPQEEAYCAACNQSFTVDAAFCPNDGARLIKLTTQADPMLGRVFDNRYEIRALLGHGGMGTVYRGWQLSVDREVAIKVIHPKRATEREVAKRFLREARLSSRLSNPNIVNVYDFGQSEDGVLYLVMELLRGHPLAKELERMRSLPFRRIKAIALQICDALSAAHAHGIVHRDLKPGNIVLLDEPPDRDALKILDFGLAKSLQENTSLVTKSDALLGTPLYMPPEQIVGEESTHLADLYSLGCIVFQLATGRPPFTGPNINATLAAHVRDPAPPLTEGPPELARLVGELLRKLPSERPQSARAVRDRIEAIGVSGVSPPSINDPSGVNVASAPALAATALSAASELTTTPSRRRWWLAAVPIALLAGGAAVVVKLTSSPSVPAPTTGPSIDAAASEPAARDAPVIDSPLDARADARADARPADAYVYHPRPDAQPSTPPLPPDARINPANLAPVDAATVWDAKQPKLEVLDHKGSAHRP